MIQNLQIRIAVTMLLLIISNSYNITIINSTNNLQVTNQFGQLNDCFISSNERLTCTMPKLYIYNDTNYQQYQIKSDGIIINSVTGKYLDVLSQINCKEIPIPNCVVLLKNGCTGKNQMNWIVGELSNGKTFEYLINCNSKQFYKPFQWGLFILICFCTITITISSFYSRAWSYKGFGFNVSKKIIIIFNIILVTVSIISYYFPHAASIWLKVFGSSIATLGVTICTSETLWLLKNRKLNQNRLSSIRILDVVSFIFGLMVTGIYWLTNGVWFINDILAVCTIIACIKLLKIRSLKNGIFILYVLLFFEILGGLLVHFVIKVSYNNLVIQMFESPLIIVFPSITPQFFRKCSWIPISNIIFPGLFISYLRRFDKSRGTILYLVIGYGTFYLGSIIWMVIDMTTPHALPIGIVSDVLTTVIVFIFALRRNQFKTIWNGFFYDTQLPDFQQNMLPSKSGDYIAFQDMTESLKLQKSQNRSIIVVNGEI